MSFRHCLLISAVLVTPVAVSAQPVDGLYVGAGFGLNLMQNESVTALPGTPAEGQLNPKVGFGGLASVGWGFGNGVRAEAEGNYRYNAFDNVSGFGLASHGSGNEQKFGFMANVLYDFVGMVPYVQPYLGVGIGYQIAYEQDVAGSAANGAFSIANRSSTGDFAYQAILGASYPIDMVPGLSLTGEYRFLGLAGERSYNAATLTVAGPAVGSAKLDDDFSHSILIGLRYAFGQPAPAPLSGPAPMAPPAPAVARTYLVFFDWDKATLSDRARQIIRDAATNVARVQVTRIEVNGYTDTSGSVVYNKKLSERRAQAVAAELVKDGVARGAIMIQAFGKTHLLVATGDGVREPQNRRVEIILH
jgi:outer membrane protein OmpA-like peptidoglycan-associated protein